MPLPDLKLSQRVRVVQTIQTRAGAWKTQVEGRVVNIAADPTGSWFAHGKQDKLWLDRLRLEKDDGEIVDLVLDEKSVVTSLETGG